MVSIKKWKSSARWSWLVRLSKLLLSFLFYTILWALFSRLYSIPIPQINLIAISLMQQCINTNIIAIAIIISNSSSINLRGYLIAFFQSKQIGNFNRMNRKSKLSVDKTIKSGVCSITENQNKTHRRTLVLYTHCFLSEL